MNNVDTDTINDSHNDYFRIEKDEFANTGAKQSVYISSNDINSVKNEDKDDVKDKEDKERTEERDEERDELYINIYRYKFTQEFMDELHNFSKIHQYDDRVQFKEAWEIWTKEYEEIIREEVEKLSYNGYQGDILDKMFKSARYYFRKKSTIKPEAKERREYVSFQKNILNIMDEHIRITKLKPANGFLDFCNSNMDALKREIAYLVDHNITDSKVIQIKFKKTYKNRYFLLNK